MDKVLLSTTSIMGKVQNKSQISSQEWKVIVVGQDMWHCSGVGVEYTDALVVCSLSTSQHQYIGCHGNREMCDGLVL